MITLKLEKLESVIFSWVLFILQRQHRLTQTCSELVYPVLRSFGYVGFSTTLNIKMLAPDRIKIIGTGSFHNMISRSLYHILFSESQFLKWFLLSNTLKHPGGIIFKFARTLL